MHIKSFIFILLLGSYVQISAQENIQFDIKLSGTTDYYRVIPHDSSSTMPDQMDISGVIEKISPGICGDLCSGGTVKLKLSSPIPGYEEEFLYIVMACFNGEPSNQEITLHVSKFLGNESECYYQQIVNIVDSEGNPFYKISQEETDKLKH